MSKKWGRPAKLSNKKSRRKTAAFLTTIELGNYLLPRSFRQLVQMFFPLKDVISLESPQKMQAG